MQTKIDRLGRFVIPKKLREDFGLYPDTFIELNAAENGIVVTKLQAQCALCGQTDNLIAQNVGTLCETCIKTFSEKLK